MTRISTVTTKTGAVYELNRATHYFRRTDSGATTTETIAVYYLRENYGWALGKQGLRMILTVETLGGGRAEFISDPILEVIDL